jgi:16S rRNA (cytosine967-C5)-methyltransferase
MTTRPVKNPRQLAISALEDVLDRGLNLSDSAALQDNRRSRDLSMSRHLAYGVLRWLTALEWLARQLLSKPLKQRDLDIHRLILLGLYQLWQDETAEHAAVHETAECARLTGKPWAVGLVNAVLRRFLRERAELLDKLAGQPERFAHPLWMLEAMQHDWPEHWQAIVAANNQQAPMWLRLNSKEHDRLEITEKLEDQGFEVRFHPSARDAVCISPAVHVTSLTGFAEGYFSVQDPAAQLAADLLDVRAGMRVLDACAAPGGKTAHLLELAELDVWAIDSDAARLVRVQDGLDRLGLRARLLAADAGNPAAWWDGLPFDAILLDAPCSASGIVRRHPDVRWLRRASDIAELAATQARLLAALWPLLAPGGRLLYCTCSVFRAEGEQQIDAFLQRQGGAGRARLLPSPGHLLPLPDNASDGAAPTGAAAPDGFYYALLEKAAR